MAFTVTADAVSIFGNMRVGVYSLTFDSSYATGGEAITASELGLSEILFALPAPKNAASGELIYRFDYTAATHKIQVFYPTGGAAAAASLVAPAFVTTSGATTVTGSAATLAGINEVAGKGTEVTSATDLSTVIIKLFVVGK